MKLAVFTHQFPGRVCTFFARDMRGLIDAGIDIDVFPIYPLDPSLWRYVPDILNEKVLPRNKVHHLTTADCLHCAKPLPAGKLGRFFADAFTISNSAISFGIEPFVKSGYAFLKAWTWAQRCADHYDQILAYWGNYSATCAYLFHRLATPSIPYSLFLHAGIDLYRNPVYMRQKLLYADNIITCSDFNRLYIERTFSDIADKIANKVFVHHHGIDLCDFSFQSNNRLPRRIVAVGRLAKEKGYEFLIRAAQQIQHSGERIEVEIVGDGSQSEYLRSLANDLGVADRITFRGWLTPEETKRAIRQATILVHPAAELGDGVPNVIKESMALGTPVVASSIAGIPELLQGGEHGVLVPPRDTDALAGAIKHLLRNPVMRSSYAESARRHVERKFDLSRNGHQLSAVLRRSDRTGSAPTETGGL
jgi:glycosyltransferase involved in cell wall biosynthesis